MADIGRSGWTKEGSSRPAPAFLPHIARRQIRAISSSGAPERSAARRSVSSRANRQVRTWPSAVRRVRSQAEQNGRVTEAMTPTRWGAAVDQPAFRRGRAARVLALGGEVEAGAQGGQDVARRHHAVALPAVLGVQGHLLDETQLVVVLDGPGEEVRGLVVVQAGHQDRVDLDRCQARVTGGLQTLQDVLVTVAAGEGLEDVGAQGVQGDVHPVQARRLQGRRRALEADAVGGQGHLRAGGESSHPLHDADQAGAQQRLTAGEADLRDAQGAHGYVDQADDLVVAEQVGLGQPLQTLLGHAVRAAQIAPVGQRDPQVGGHSAVGVDEHVGPLPRSDHWCADTCEPT